MVEEIPHRRSLDDVAVLQLDAEVAVPVAEHDAAGFAGQVPAALAVERRDRLMRLQQRISREQQRALVGKRIEVLVHGVSEETDLLLQGRHKGQAPDIDGVTYINDGVASPGEVVRVLVDQAGDYDLVGGIVRDESAPRPRRPARRRPRDGASFCEA